MTFKGSKPLRAAKGTKPLALGRGHTKRSPGIIDVEENVLLTMKCLHTKVVGDQRRKGDASLKLTSRQIEKTLVLEGEDGTGGSHGKPSALIDNRENTALTRKENQQRKGEMQASNSPAGKVNGVLSQMDKAELGESKKTIGDQLRKGDANLELTNRQSERSLVSEQGGDGGSQGEMSALTDDGENVALIRKFEKAKRNLINI
ncbi:hypothetical protein BKA82DRAFT_4018752 [Pisolithus tinctorius]|nr:hypothetical protein BKA82DRAFT_4018752 [Pisolithus tinctorius]